MSNIQKLIDSLPVEDVKAPPQYKKIVVLATKDLEQEDKERIQRHGKLYIYNDSNINVSLAKIDADYVVVDANNDAYLKSIDKEFNQSNDIGFCAYCAFYEKEHFNNINAFCTFKDTATKNDFDFLLLNKRQLKSPNTLLSCLFFLVAWVSKLKK